MRTRLLTTMLAVTAVLLGVLLVPLGVQTARGERSDLRAKVERDATAVASLSEETLEKGGPAPPAIVGLARRYLRETGGRIVVVDRRGTSVVDAAGRIGRDFASRPEIALALSGSVASGTRRSETLDATLLYVAVPIASGGVVRGAARVTYPTRTADERLRKTWTALAGIAALALVVSAGLAVWFARWASRPLVRLEEAASAVTAGDLAARAPVDGPPEVRAVAESFNAMVDRVDGMLAAQSDFVADASHQLRTPLTALGLRLENLAVHEWIAADPDLEAARLEVERLNELVDGLLALARAGEDAAPAEILELGAVAAERVTAWQALAAERAIALTIDHGSEGRVRVGRLRFEQVLDNLLANAFDAVEPGGRVSVLLEPTRDGMVIRVRDDGPGMAPNERARAFDRFWRARSSPGSGLGLPIARRLVEVDHGELALDDAPGHGLDAIIRYPKA